MGSPTVSDSLLLVHGIEPDERDHVVAALEHLDSRLRSYPDGTVTLRLNIKGRGTDGQRTSLEASIAGRPDVVAISDHPEFDQAIHEVRHEMERQLTDAKERTQAKISRQRHPR